MDTVKDKGIPFNYEMVRAILNTRPGSWPAEPINPHKPWKWQTRRVMRPQPELIPDDVPKVLPYDRTGFWWRCSKTRMMIAMHDAGCVSPYGPLGRRLYVKENWQTGERLDQFSGSEIRRKAVDAGYEEGPACPLWYPADDFYLQWGDNDMEDFGRFGRIRHARFMPQWASRITLEVKAVRFQRINEITEADIIAEGCPTEYLLGKNWYRPLWEKIHGEGAWEKNQFVFAYDIMRLK